MFNKQQNVIQLLSLRSWEGGNLIFSLAFETRRVAQKLTELFCRTLCFVSVDGQDCHAQRCTTIQFRSIRVSPFFFLYRVVDGLKEFTSLLSTFDVTKAKKNKLRGPLFVMWWSGGICNDVKEPFSFSSFCLFTLDHLDRYSPTFSIVFVQHFCDRGGGYRIIDEEKFFSPMTQNWMLIELEKFYRETKIARLVGGTHIISGQPTKKTGRNIFFLLRGRKKQ